MGDDIANVKVVVPLASAEATVRIADAKVVHACPDFNIDVNPNHPLCLHPHDNLGMSPISTKLI